MESNKSNNDEENKNAEVSSPGKPESRMIKFGTTAH
jgi:hypothetical protein